jgi:hypothetical protein
MLFRFCRAFVGFAIVLAIGGFVLLARGGLVRDSFSAWYIRIAPAKTSAREWLIGAICGDGQLKVSCVYATADLRLLPLSTVRPGLGARHRATARRGDWFSYQVHVGAAVPGQPQSGVVYHSALVAVPDWFLILPCLPILVATYHRRRRPVPGHCRRCGYDLRATPDRCPECGSVQATSVVDLAQLDRL